MMWMQNTVVAIAVIFCTLYAAWLLTPARPRLRATQWMLRAMPQSEDRPGLLRRIVLRLNRKAMERFESVCGKCSTNGGSEKPR